MAGDFYREICMKNTIIAALLFSALPAAACTATGFGIDYAGNCQCADIAGYPIHALCDISTTIQGYTWIAADEESPLTILRPNGTVLYYNVNPAPRVMPAISGFGCSFSGGYPGGSFQCAITEPEFASKRSRCTEFNYC